MNLSLVLQEKWSKQLAKKDYDHYLQLFEAITNKHKVVKHLYLTNGRVTPLKLASNHKSQSLLTIFYKNISQTQINDPEFIICYDYKGTQLSGKFKIHDLELKPNESTLWTLIFDTHVPLVSEETWLVSE